MAQGKRCPLFVQWRVNATPFERSRSHGRLSFSDIRWSPSSVLRQANSPQSQCRRHWSASWFWPGWRMDGRTDSPPAKREYYASLTTGRGNSLHSQLSRRPTFVPMMKTANLRQRDHLPKLRRLHRPTRRRVLFQRQVRSRLVIILHVRLHVSAQRLLVENDHVVDALSPNRTDHALDVGPLPGGTRRRGHFFDAQMSYLLGEVGSEDAIPSAAAAGLAAGLGFQKTRLAFSLHGPERA